MFDQLFHRAAVAAGLAVVGALWLAFFTLLGAAGSATPYVLGVLAVLGLLGAWRYAAAAPVRRWRRFARQFTPPVRDALAVVMDEAGAGRAWAAAGLSRPILVDRAGDWGVVPTADGAALRIRRRPGHHVPDYAGAAPVLARALGVTAVRVVGGPAGVLHLYLHVRRAPTPGGGSRTAK
ncbi:hypothetical protein [Nocardia jiangsuensis]|uniref:Type VII secretion protein EccE n=1 Tax=Nocardia jiangsuensis TaxID=1691563 RepID=A0ABV8DZL1_9NOCA